MAYTSMGTDPKAKKTNVTLHFQKGKTKRSYQPADVRTGDTRYGSESKTKPTPDFVKRAQAAKVDVIHKEGKPYRAGFSTEHTEADTHTTKLQHTPEIPKRVKSAYETIQTKQNTADIRQKSGSAMKRRLPRVDYLQGKGYGRNKRTESGFGK